MTTKSDPNAARAYRLRNKTEISDEDRAWLTAYERAHPPGGNRRGRTTVTVETDAEADAAAAAAAPTTSGPLTGAAATNPAAIRAHGERLDQILALCVRAWEGAINGYEKALALYTNRLDNLERNYVDSLAVMRDAIIEQARAEIAAEAAAEGDDGDEMVRELIGMAKESANHGPPRRPAPPPAAPPRPADDVRAAHGHKTQTAPTPKRRGRPGAKKRAA